MMAEISLDSNERIEKLVVGLTKNEPYPYRRSADLHNFKDMPTPWLSWGNQKISRDAKFHALKSSAVDYCFNSTDFDYKHVRSLISKVINQKRKVFAGTGIVEDEGIGFGIGAVREKPTADLKNAADSKKFEKLKRKIDNEREEEDINVDDLLEAAIAAAVVEEGVVEGPGNLRARRATCKAPNLILNEKAAVSVSSLKTENLMKSSRSRRGEKTTESRAKFSMALSKSRKEEDYLIMTGAKPPRRPKKRSKTEQEQLNTFFPGLWLREVTPEMFKVQEFRTPKRNR